jgi:hypothetical protein
MDFRRLGVGDLVALGGTVLLFISLFLSWYSATGEDVNGNTITVSGTALGQYAGGWRFLILVIAIIVVLYLLARTLAPRGFHLPLPHWQVLTILVGLQFLLTLLAFLVKPTTGVAGVGVSWEYGAFIGLVASLIAAAGAIMRRNEPEVVVPGAPRSGFGSFRSVQQTPQQYPSQPYSSQPAVQPPGAAPVACAQCGAAVAPGAPYCASCGAPSPT